ncbi:hypothetical protein HD597_006842 [Nonomuraea thailandensis]|uniref:Uncharacterized protein n=1 Tax=Nonomuraea thailandensis TaxID=1188745 RepID=A0A9X2GKA2_9ACTN|nr:hypothetical protein [Nonomuraea thailandensis]MCP2359822.1 hypothetical protein [Nonomuraea thailandensis]
MTTMIARTHTELLITVKALRYAGGTTSQMLATIARLLTDPATPDQYEDNLHTVTQTAAHHFAYEKDTGLTSYPEDATYDDLTPEGQMTVLRHVVFDLGERNKPAETSPVTTKATDAATRYLARAIDEPDTFALGLDGASLPPHHLVAIAEAEADTEDGETTLFPLPKIVAILDTGVPLGNEALALDGLLDRNGWKLTGESDSHPDNDAHEVAPTDPQKTPPAVEYHDGRPMPYYIAGRKKLDERGSLMDALLVATFTAAQATDPAKWGLDHTGVELLLTSATRAAVDDRLDYEQVVRGNAGLDCKRRLFAAACAAIDTALDVISERATCRTCDGPALSRTTHGKPVCANTGH